MVKIEYYLSKFRIFTLFPLAFCAIQCYNSNVLMRHTLEGGVIEYEKVL